MMCTSVRKAVFLLGCFASFGAAAQQDCLDAELTHFEGEMPEASHEWFIVETDSEHVQANLTFAAELDGAVFFQAVAQREENDQVEYAFPLEVLDHPLTTDAKEIEFIVSNEQLPGLTINLIFLEQPYLACSGKKSYSYLVRVD